MCRAGVCQCGGSWESLWGVGGGGGLTQVRPSARACVAEASSMAKSRKERDLEKVVVCWRVGFVRWVRRRVVKPRMRSMWLRRV